MPKTQTPHPTDRSMWRVLLKRCHPDSGGSSDLFVWVNHIREYVLDDTIEEPLPRVEREPPKHPTTGDRLDYTEAFSFGSFTNLTRSAVDMGEQADSPQARLLTLLSDCEEALPADTALYRQQNEGATYKTLAAIAHQAGFTKAQRVAWYRLAERVPLAQRHAGHILMRLRRAA
jgi:hypothetical protein